MGHMNLWVLMHTAERLMGSVQEEIKATCKCSGYQVLYTMSGQMLHYRMKRCTMFLTKLRSETHTSHFIILF
jgi:hypothetical protein